MKSIYLGSDLEDKGRFAIIWMKGKGCKPSLKRLRLKIGIYPAALGVYGGGEKYIGKIAEILSRENDVGFVVFAEPDFWELESRLNIDLSRVTIDNIRSSASLLPKRCVSLRRFIDAHRVSKCTKEYDLFINQEHMTFIPSSARGSILICEVPPVRPSLIENLFEGLLFDPRIRTYDTIVVNSCYTKKWAEKYYGKEATVLYPPIDTQSFVSSMKENIILSVGRFFAGGHCKKQLEMINAFKQLCTEQELTDWEYYLVGGLGDNPEGHKYLEECKKEAKGYPVLFHINAPFEVVRELYGRAKIFWHATGLGEDENQHPERMEHFGITTAEAMSAGCVPVVINKGGQTEIVRHGVDGFLWNTVQELKEYTVRLINDNALQGKMGEESVARSQDFSMEKFEQRVKQVFLEV